MSGCDQRLAYGVRMKTLLALLLLATPALAQQPKLAPAVSITRSPAEAAARAPAARAMAVVEGRTPTADEMRLLELTNQARAVAGLRPLVWNSALAAAAQEHSDDLAAHGGNCPSLHDSCNGELWIKRLDRFYPNWTALGENVAENTADPQALHDGWMASAGHRANILNNAFTEFGTAITLGQTAFGKIAFGTEDFGSRGAIGPTPKPLPSATPTPSPRPTHVKTPRPSRTPKPTPRPKPSRTSGHR